MNGKLNHINPRAKQLIKKFKPSKVDVTHWLHQLKKGNTAILSKAITLIESKLNTDQSTAQSLMSKCIAPVDSIRIGITGPPGAGKSTFIEKFGNEILNHTHSKLAVLTIDPSSPDQGGSVLGDKTRMQTLAVNPRVFIRPSAAGRSLGGLHQNTRDAITLCEYSGFQYIIVESVGVGQSEIDIHQIVDINILLINPFSGDELQGIKRGINESADLIIINKDDSGMEQAAKLTKQYYAQAMHFSQHETKLFTCSSLTGNHIHEIYLYIQSFIEAAKKSKIWDSKRKKQRLFAFNHLIEAKWINELYTRSDQKPFKQIVSKIRSSKMDLKKLSDDYIHALKRKIS